MHNSQGGERAGAGFLGPLRTIALVALLAGAVGSVGLTLRAGRHSPRVLLVLFTAWVLIPFVALLWTIVVSGGWSILTQASLSILTLVVAASSLTIYGLVVARAARKNPTPTFVVVPPASCLLIAVVISLAALMARRLARRSNRS